jgi:hypothetical protein
VKPRLDAATWEGEAAAMFALLLLAAQSVIGPVSDDEPALPPPLTQRDCRRGTSDEIVVCARDQESFRLRPLGPPSQQAQRLGPAQVRLAPNTTLSAQAKPGPNAAAPAPRAMVTVSVDF